MELHLLELEVLFLDQEIKVFLDMFFCLLLEIKYLKSFFDNAIHPRVGVNFF